MSQQKVSESEQGCEQLTLSVADSLVSRLVAPGGEKARMTNDTFGRNSLESFAKLDPGGYWAKTYADSCQLTLDGRLEEYSQTWPKSGIVLDGYVMELPLLAHRTKGTGCLLWATPAAYEDRTSPETWEKRGRDIKGAELSMQVRYMEEQAMKMWPTPTSREWKGARTLEALAAAGRTITNTLGDAVRAQEPGQLNPMWVEWLMGFPNGWTDLDA